MAHFKRHRRAGGSAHGGVRQGRRAVFLAAGLLVLISLYSVTIGSNGWLWFGWAVLLMVCAALFAVRD
ncbi:hypothetical protein [Kitasatospora herbaricolor]|uniref:Uncharacterized protein n=1 Tax=Kitasatospora herbaricolor TaxID=68217 RepID=A0ABZ1WLV8_9ACTN|nr:hypothetical protein [Kitasatospora herbaricolor]